MNNISLRVVLIVVMLYSSFGGSVYADSVVGRIDRIVTNEDNGLTWTLLSTRYGAREVITQGLEINGKTIVPLYKGVAYFMYKKIGNGGVFQAKNIEMPGSHKEYIIYNIDGKIIFETGEWSVTPEYDSDKGLYFKEGNLCTYLPQKLDINGRIFSNDSPIYVASTIDNSNIESLKTHPIILDEFGTQISSELKSEANGFKWYETQRGDKYGVVTENLKELLPPIFDWLRYADFSVGEKKNEEEPFFQVAIRRNGSLEYEAYNLEGKLAKFKRILRNINGFKFYDVFNRGVGRWSIEDVSGNIIIPEHDGTIFYYPSDYLGGFFHLTYFSGGLCAEIYNQAGNLIIPRSRNYWQVRLQKSYDKFFVTQNEDGIGMCDLNGYEVAPPVYISFEYDGYDFKGTTKDGNIVTKCIHKRPTPKQTQVNNNIWGFYYSNMPWLMMPGPSYVPTFTFDWSTPNIDWSSISVYGGIGDYVSEDTNLIGDSMSPSTSVSGSSHKCPYCNGTGKREVNQGIATYGTSDVKVHCNECGRDFYRSSGHSHVFCGHCGGTGMMK